MSELGLKYCFLTEDLLDGFQGDKERSLFILSVVRGVLDLRNELISSLPAWLDLIKSSSSRVHGEYNLSIIPSSDCVTLSHSTGEDWRQRWSPCSVSEE